MMGVIVKLDYTEGVWFKTMPSPLSFVFPLGRVHGVDDIYLVVNFNS